MVQTRLRCRLVVGHHLVNAANLNGDRSVNRDHLLSGGELGCEVEIAGDIRQPALVLRGSEVIDVRLDGPAEGRVGGGARRVADEVP